MASSKATPKKPSHITKGQAVHRGALPRRDPSTHSAHRIYVNGRSPFRSITTRVRKQLDKSLRAVSSTDPQSLTNKVAAKNHLLPLSKRIEALQKGPDDGIAMGNAREVVVIGAGKAIEKVVNVAAFFQGQGDVEVQLRTGSLGTVDEIMPEEEENGLGLGVGERERLVSCLEAVIKLR
ncbi:putative Rpp20 subunit of nuclear RNase MRP and P-domain-containing protein [Seiridium unicorne]|uniref:Rpp20 subunit of nuclear RNase MRP and P-domain-containing protein n=1 Tax=Seiridium unicorne TaxID=138068 RepID=A0ABR2UEZ4_9PEZI